MPANSRRRLTGAADQVVTRAGLELKYSRPRRRRPRSARCPGYHDGCRRPCERRSGRADAGTPRRRRHRRRRRRPRSSRSRRRRARAGCRCRPASSMVPPTEVTSGSAEGQLFTRIGYRSVPFSLGVGRAVVTRGPSTVTPCASAFLNAERRSRSDCLFGNVCSVAPKLCEITSPRWWLITKFSAWTISGKPCTPSVSATGVSSSRILAPGANDVRPLDVERGLVGPAGHVAVGRVERRHGARVLPDRQGRRVGQAERLVEDVQVVGDGR